MRWDALFGDLEAQAEVLEAAERAAEVDERARIEVGRLRIVDRLQPAIGVGLRLHCAGGLVVAGLVRRLGPDWVLVEEASGREAVVALAAVYRIDGLGRVSAVPQSEDLVASRLGLRHALRGLARDRAVVRVSLIDGDSLDGTIDRVGADFIETAAHAAGEPRRSAAVRDVHVIALPALAAVHHGL